jgi:hypothetical protein
MKSTPFAITAFVNIGVGVFLFFILLLSLNGFSEDEATPGLILFIVWILIVSLLTAVLSVVATNFLTAKKSMSFWIAALISVLLFVIVGGVFNIIGLFASVLVTSAMQ